MTTFTVSNKKVVLNLQTARELNTDNMKLISQKKKMQKGSMGLHQSKTNHPQGLELQVTLCHQQLIQQLMQQKIAPIF